MVNANKLKGAMLIAGFNNVEDAAKAIGMPPNTMYRKLRKGVFGSNEIEQMIKAYRIDKSTTVDIFFDTV